MLIKNYAFYIFLSTFILIASICSAGIFFNKGCSNRQSSVVCEPDTSVLPEPVVNIILEPKTKIQPKENINNDVLCVKIQCDCKKCECQICLCLNCACQNCGNKTQNIEVVKTETIKVEAKSEPMVQEEVCEQPAYQYYERPRLFRRIFRRR